MVVRLTERQLVAAGVDVVANDGWSALSLRAVAERLGVTPMALYRHVTDSEALRAAVLDEIAGRLATPCATGDLAADLAEWARRLHRDLEEFPGVAAHLLTGWFECPPMLDRIEQLLALVARGGIEGFDAVATTNALLMYVLMRSEAERAVRTAGVVRRSLRTGAAGRDHPRLRALSEHYTTARFDLHFEFGLAALIAGLDLEKSGLLR